MHGHALVSRRRYLQRRISILMMDYKRPGHNQPILQAYARIKKLLEHESYPGGPVPDCEDLDHTGMQEQTKPVQLLLQVCLPY
jgi:hypothetical protein